MKKNIVASLLVSTYLLSGDVSAVIPSGGISTWSDSDIEGITTAEIVSFTQGEMDDFSWSQVSWFTIPQTQALYAEPEGYGYETKLGYIIRSLSYKKGHALTQAQIQSLTPYSRYMVDRTSDSQLTWLTALQIAAFPVSELDAIATHSAAKVGVFTRAQMPHFSQAQIDALGGVPALTATQIPGVQSSIIHAIPAVGFEDLTAEQKGAFTADHISGFSQAQIDGMGGIAGLTVTQISDVPASIINAMTAADITALSADRKAALSSTQITGFDQTKINAMGGVAALSAAQIPGVQTSVIGALSGSDLSAMSDAKFSAMTGAQFAAVSTDKVSSLSATKKKLLPAAYITGLSLEQIDSMLGGIKNLTGTQIGGLKSTIIPLLTTELLASLSTEQKNGFTEAHVGQFTDAQFDAAFKGVVASLSPEQLPLDKVKVLPVASYPSNKFARLSGDKLKELTPEQVKATSGIKLRGLESKDQLSKFPVQHVGDTIKDLKPEQFELLGDNVKNLTVDQLKLFRERRLTDHLTVEQVDKLTKEQLESLGGVETFPAAQIPESRIKTLDMSKLSADKISGMSVSQLQNMTDTQVSKLPRSFIENMGDINKVRAQNVAALSEDNLKLFLQKFTHLMTQSQMNSIKKDFWTKGSNADFLTRFSSTRLSGFTYLSDFAYVLPVQKLTEISSSDAARIQVDHLKKLSYDRSKAISVTHNAQLSKDQRLALRYLPSLNASELKEVKTADLNASYKEANLSEQLNALSDAQVQALSVDQINFLAQQSAFSNIDDLGYSSLSSTQYSSLSSALFSTLSPERLNKISPDLLATTSDEKIKSIPKTTAQKMDQGRLHALGSKINLVADKLSEPQVLKLTDAQRSVVVAQNPNVILSSPTNFRTLGGMENVPVGNVTSLSSGIVQSFNQADISKLTDDKLGALTKEQLALFSVEQVGMLSQHQVTLLANQSFVRNVSISIVGAAYSPPPVYVSKLNAFSVKVIGVSKHIASIPVRTMNGLAKEKLLGALVASNVQAIPTSTIGNLSLEVLGKQVPLKDLSTAQVAAINKQQAQSLTSAEFDTLSMEQMQALSLEAVKGMDSTKAKAFLSKVGAFTDQQILALPEGVIPLVQGQLTPAAIASLGVEQLKKLNLKKLSKEHVKAITTAQIPHLTNDQVASLVKGMFTIELKAGDDDKIVTQSLAHNNSLPSALTLSTAQIGALTESQFQTLMSRGPTVSSLGLENWEDNGKLSVLRAEHVKHISTDALELIQPMPIELMSKLSAEQVKKLDWENIQLLDGFEAIDTSLVQHLSAEFISDIPTDIFYEIEDEYFSTHFTEAQLSAMTETQIVCLAGSEGMKALLDDSKGRNAMGTMMSAAYSIVPFSGVTQGDDTKVEQQSKFINALGGETIPNRLPAIKAKCSVSRRNILDAKYSSATSSTESKARIGASILLMGGIEITRKVILMKNPSLNVNARIAQSLRGGIGNNPKQLKQKLSPAARNNTKVEFQAVKQGSNQSSILSVKKGPRYKLVLKKFAAKGKSVGRFGKKLLKNKSHIGLIATVTYFGASAQKEFSDDPYLRYAPLIMGPPGIGIIAGQEAMRWLAGDEGVKQMWDTTAKVANAIALVAGLEASIVQAQIINFGKFIGADEVFTAGSVEEGLMDALKAAAIYTFPPLLTIKALADPEATLEALKGVGTGTIKAIVVAAEGVASGAVAIASFTKTAVKATYSKAKSFVSSMGGLFD